MKNQVIDIIKKTVDKIRKDYPDITSEMLLDNGHLFYMNGNDGTRFDMEVNEHLCEFCCFYKESRLCFLKVIPYLNDTLTVYVYGDKEALLPCDKIEISVPRGSIRELGEILLETADLNHFWDKSIYYLGFEHGAVKTGSNAYEYLSYDEEIKDALEARGYEVTREVIAEINESINDYCLAYLEENNAELDEAKGFIEDIFADIVGDFLEEKYGIPYEEEEQK